MNEITMAVTHPRKQKPQSRVASRPYLPQLGSKHSLRQRPEDAELHICQEPRMWVRLGEGPGFGYQGREQESCRAQTSLAYRYKTGCLHHLNFR